MTRFQKTKEIITGLIMIMIAVLMMESPSEGYKTVITLLAFMFIVRGISSLYFYFSMSRFMVGGRTSLFMGVIMLDLGMLSASLTDVPHYYVLLYLIAINAFSGFIMLLRALEARRYGTSWKLKLSHGLVDLFMAAACIVFIKHMSMAVIVYSIGLIYSAAMRIFSAFRKTKFVYIQ